MKIPDVNILVYAYDSTSPFHSRARSWLTTALSDQRDPVGIVPAVALSFIRLTCNPKVYANPSTIDQACQTVASWIDSGAIWVDPSTDHFAMLGRLVQEAHGSVNLLADAYLAALAIERRATLYSNDRDFARFKGLKFKNPFDQ